MRVTAFHTVAPLAWIRLDAGEQYDFGAGVALREVPDWLAKEQMLKQLAEWDRRLITEECRAAFVATYEADSLGSPDPDWKGKEKRSIQETKYEACVLANVAMWLSSPTPATFS